MAIAHSVSGFKVTWGGGLKVAVPLSLCIFRFFCSLKFPKRSKTLPDIFVSLSFHNVSSAAVV